MNLFLKSVNTTYRGEAADFTLRINKMGSKKDLEQKKSGEYLLLKKEQEESSLADKKKPKHGKK